MLTDGEVQHALLTAGIPRRYHGKTRCVGETGQGDKLHEWIKTVAPFSKGQYLTPEDGVKGLYLYGGGGLDAVYLTARGLLVSGVSVRVFTLPDLFAGNLYEIANDLDSLVVGIVGYNEAGVEVPGPVDRIFAVQWWITKLLNAGKVLLIQGEYKPEINRDWWGRTLTRLVKRTSLIVQCGEVT